MTQRNLDHANIHLGLSGNSEFVKLFGIGSTSEGSFMIFPNEDHKKFNFLAVNTDLPTKTNSSYSNLIAWENASDIKEPKIHFHKSGFTSIKSQLEPINEVKGNLDPLLDYEGEQFFTATIVNPNALPRINRMKPGDITLFVKPNFPDVYCIAGFIQNAKNLRELHDFKDLGKKSGFINNGSYEVFINRFNIGDEEFLVTYKGMPVNLDEIVKFRESSISILCTSKENSASNQVKSLAIKTSNHLFPGYAFASRDTRPLTAIGEPSPNRDLKKITRKLGLPIVNSENLT